MYRKILIPLDCHVFTWPLWPDAMILGSVTETVVRHCGDPVLISRPLSGAT
jgi:hypothetical protein